MGEWHTDERNRKTFGSDLSVVSQTRGGETAHLVDLGDRSIRVLPDEAHSGQKRALVVREALETIAALNGISGDVREDLFVGRLARAGLDFEAVSVDGLPIEDWLARYFHEEGWPVAAPSATAETLVADLAADGWEITRD